MTGPGPLYSWAALEARAETDPILASCVAMAARTTREDALIATVIWLAELREAELQAKREGPGHER